MLPALSLSVTSVLCGAKAEFADEAVHGLPLLLQRTMLGLDFNTTVNGALPPDQLKVSVPAFLVAVKLVIPGVATGTVKFTVAWSLA